MIHKDILEEFRVPPGNKVRLLAYDHNKLWRQMKV